MTLTLDRTTWTRVRFGDVVSNVNETIREPLSAGIDRVIAMEHLDPGELKITRWGNPEDGTTFTRRVRPGQTLFGKRRAYQRKAAYAEFDAICSGDILTFQANPTKLIPELLPFLVQSDGFYEHALGTSAGSLSPRTNWKDLSNYEFDLPPLDEQHRMADLLWTIEKRRQRLVALRDTVRRVSDIASTSLFEADEADSARKLSEVCNDITVGVVVRPTSYYTDSSDGVPALRSLNIAPGRFVLDELVRFRPDAHATLTKSTVRAGDVVVVRTGRPGDAAVIDASTDGFNCIDLIIVRVGDDLDAHYLTRFLNSTHGRRRVLRGSAGTAQQHFNVGALSKLELRIPPLPRQREIVTHLESLERPVEAVSAELDSLSILAGAVVGAVFGGVA